MADRKPNAIVIGTEAIAEYLSKMSSFAGWTWELPVTSAKAFVDGVENDTITTDVEAIFVVDVFFDQGRDEADAMVTILAEYSQFAFVGVLSYDAEISQKLMKKAKRDQRSELGHTDAINQNVFLIGQNSADGDSLKAIDKFRKYGYHEAEESIKLISAAYDDRNVTAQQSFDSEMSEEAIAGQSKDAEARDHREKDNYHKVDKTEFGPKKGKLITFTSSKGGVGKSTVSVSSAALLAKKSAELLEEGSIDTPWKILLLDMDVLDSQLGYFTKTKGATISEIFQGGINLESIKKAVHYNDDLGFSLILGSRHPEVGRYYPDDFYDNVIEALLTLYDFVILDTSVDYTSHLIGEVCYRKSDRIFLVVEPVVPCVLSASKWVDFTLKSTERGGLELDPSIIKIVVNRYQTEQKTGFMGPGSNTNNLGIEAVMKIGRDKIEIASIIPFLPTIVASATNNGKMNLIPEAPGLEPAFEQIYESILDSMDDDNDNEE